MKRFLALLPLLAVSVSPVCQAGETNAAEALGMTQRQFTQGNLSIAYCERVFQPRPGAPMHILVTWHGGSGRGDDNHKQLTTYSVRDAIAYLETNRVNCVVLSPQCPSSAVSWLSGGAKSPLQATRALARTKAKDYRVMPDRTFFAGISMGGTAAYNLLSADTPSLFGKALVCSGAGDTSLADRITTSVRVFNGTADTIIDPEGGRAMAAAIAAAGGRAAFFLLEGYEHATAAEVAFSAPQWDWFFKSRAFVFVIQ